MKLKWKSQDELEMSGQPPQGRYDHGMQRFNNAIILFGGRKMNSDHPFASSIYLLELSNLTWIKLRKKGSPQNMLRSEFC